MTFAPMIDLHLHLLPGIDDGASSKSITEEMLDIAAQLGFTRLVATPHLDGPLEPSYQNKAETLASDVAAIGRSFGIAVDRGYEIQLDPGLAKRIQAGAPVTLAGSQTVLVELPFAGWPHHAGQSLFELQAAGVRPLLAHPERYAAAQSDIERVVELAQRGVLLQVTFSSLTGLFGRGAQRVAEELLERNLVTVLATDAHGAGQRLLGVSKGIERARELVGEERLDQLVRVNPAALLADRPLPETAVVTRSKVQAAGLIKGLASRFRSG
jgi:protein-tyrosine phosphatase